MFNSKKYWENRYKNNGNSGTGSYNELANFKAEIINNFIEKNKIQSLIDHGVGDGNQLKLINTENLIYTGIDVSKFIISKCKEEFKGDKTKKFIHVDNIDNELKADLVLSCDVIYHLIEDSVYKKYMENLFTFSKKYVIIYSKNEDVNHAIHVKFRKFSNYIESNLQEWKLIKHIPNEYPQLILGKDNDKTSPSDFYIYEKKKSNIILTASLGKNRHFINHTKQFMKQYSLKTNADFEIITDTNNIFEDSFYNNIDVGRGNNKTYLLKLLIIIHYLKKYDKVLWIDDTCIIKNNCENLFNKTVNNNCIVAYNEGINTSINSWKIDYNYILEKTGYKIITNNYINVGVVVYTKKLLEIMTFENIQKYKILFISPYPEQCFINFLIQKFNISLVKLENKYNNMLLNCTYEKGRDITPNEIGKEYILSDNNKIFHITGFYANRSLIIEFIYKVLH